MKKTLKIFGTLLTSICLTQCSSIHDNWNGVVRGFGEYHFAKNGYILKTSNENGILHYTLENENRRILIESDRKLDDISVYIAWAMCFDDRDNFWVNSSDIGVTCWKAIGKDEYQRIQIYRGDPLILQMPSALGKP